MPKKSPYGSKFLRKPSARPLDSVLLSRPLRSDFALRAGPIRNGFAWMVRTGLSLAAKGADVPLAPMEDAGVLGSLELLCEDAALRRLLDHYRVLRGNSAEPAWHDRLNEFAAIEPRRLSRMYGLLIAWGWLDVRIAAETLANPGLLTQAYQITREGMRALRQTEDQFGAPQFVPSTEEEEIGLAA